jgi:ubiquitin-protein ligase
MAKYNKINNKSINMDNIEDLLINWRLLNKKETSYLNNIKYNKNNNITFDVEINSDILYFSLKIPNQSINLCKYFVLEPTITNNNNIIYQIICDYINNLATKINYNNIQSALTKILNEINDKCYNIENDEDDEDIEDIWKDEDECDKKINIKSLNNLKIIETSLNIIKDEHNSSDIKHIINNFSDKNRIQMLLNEIEEINNKYDNIIIRPIDDNIFKLNIKLNNFSKNKFEITMNMELDVKLYPYYPPKISFNTIFDNNLSYNIIQLDYFKVHNWNVTNRLEHTIISIWKIIDKYGLISNCSKISDNNLIELLELLNNLSNITDVKPLNYNNIDIKIDYMKLDTNNKINNIENIGYGSNNRSTFDIKNYINSVELKNKMIYDCLFDINNKLIKFKLKDRTSSRCLDVIYVVNFVLPIIASFMQNIQLLELNNYNKLYTELFKLIRFMIDFDNTIIDYEFNKTNLKHIFKSCNDVLNTYKSVNNSLTDIEQLLNNLLDTYKSLYNYNMGDEQKNMSITEEYIEFIKKNNFKLLEKFNKPLYVPSDYTTSECKNINRIAREMTLLKTSLPINWSSSIFVKFNKQNMSLIKVGIIGPNDTPYENGFYEFHIKLSEGYPDRNPSCHFQTTGGGRVRFNPNLYDSGKVCLSLLGTWHGHESEQWNAKTSTILQLLISIQSLIFCEKPYFNEPGYESTYNSEQGKFKSDEYNKQIQYNSIDLAIIEQINNPIEDFKDDIYTHFNFKRNEIINTFNKWLKTNKSLENLRDRLLDALDRVKI